MIETELSIPGIIPLFAVQILLLSNAILFGNAPSPLLVISETGPPGAVGSITFKLGVCESNPVQPDGEIPVEGTR
jgi:hypothetical protein